MNYVITAKCANGHSEDYLVDGFLGLDWVLEHTNILDGTSNFFLGKKPAESDSSLIGRCGVCRAHLVCNVTSSILTAEDVTSPEAD